MPLIKIEPKDRAIEDAINKVMEVLRATVKGRISSLTGFPTNDVIVRLSICTTRNADPDQSDAVIFIDTNPGEEIELLSEDVVDAVVETFREIGLLKVYKTEFWIRFLPGHWALYEEGVQIDVVRHIPS